MSSDIPVSNEEDLLQIEPPPSGEHRRRIHFIAKVLAYGALSGQWSPHLRVTPLNDPGGESWQSLGRVDYHERLSDYLAHRWNKQQPQAAFLESFGYLERKRTPGTSVDYIVTEKAFALLETPAGPPKVFISYHHKTSSAFAMMLEYRLEAKGIPVFIDRSIPKGDAWHVLLKAKVQQCQYFVCLICDEALGSLHVQKEIEWAENQIRIPIWHPNFRYDIPNPDHPKWLQEFVTGKQAICVLQESAEAYHDAAEKLLNALGYSSP